MSIFDRDETLCNRAHNTCKLRNKCLRYLRVHGDNDWVADYWQEFGKFCDHHIPLAKEEIIVNGLSKAIEKKE